MDFITSHFKPERVVPLHKVNFPVSLRMEIENGSIPKVYQGRLFRYSGQDEPLCSYDEESLCLEHVNSGKRFIGGGYAFLDDAFICSEEGESQTQPGLSYEIDMASLSIRRSFEFPLAGSHDSFSFKNRSLVFIPNWVKGLYQSYFALIDRENASLIWKKLSPFSWKVCAGNNKAIIAVGYKCQIIAIDYSTGNVLWQKTPPDLGVLTEQEEGWWHERPATANNSLHIYNNQVIVGVPGGILVALDLDTGETLWHYRHKAHHYHTVADWRGRLYHFSDRIYDPLTYRSTVHPALYVFDLNNGTLEKEFEIEIKPKKLAKLVQPCMHADVTETHYIGMTSYGLLMAINLETGKVDWKYNLEGHATHGVGLFACNNRLYAQVLRGFVPHNFIFEGEGGYIPD